MKDYLFTWRTMSISFSIIFITLISIYLYVSSKPKRRDDIPEKTSALKMGKDFVFVLVLVGLLLFYISRFNWHVRTPQVYFPKRSLQWETSS